MVALPSLKIWSVGTDLLTAPNNMMQKGCPYIVGDEKSALEWLAEGWAVFVVQPHNESCGGVTDERCRRQCDRRCWREDLGRQRKNSRSIEVGWVWNLEVWNGWNGWHMVGPSVGTLRLLNVSCASEIKTEAATLLQVTWPAFQDIDGQQQLESRHVELRYGWRLWNI